MIRFKSLRELLTETQNLKHPGKSAFLMTGSFGPYTKGHEEMARRAAHHAAANGYTHFYHGIGGAKVSKDNPLSHEDKAEIIANSHKHIEKSLPNEHKGHIRFGIIPKEHTATPFHQIGHLIEKGHKHIAVALGSDQFARHGLKDAITKHIETHGGWKGTDGKIHQVSIKFHKLGADRNEKPLARHHLLRHLDKGNLAVVKAGRLRDAVRKGDQEVAHALMPISVANKKKYFNTIKKGLGLSENFDPASFLSVIFEKYKRDYRAERIKLYGTAGKQTAKQRANRKKKVNRTLARRKAIKLGRVRKGEKSKEIDHRNGNALDNSSKNLRVVSRYHNRSRNNNKGH